MSVPISQVISYSRFSLVLQDAIADVRADYRVRRRYRTLIVSDAGCRTSSSRAWA